MWGGSYGGYLTAMGLAKSSDLFAAGVDIHGVHDWNSGIQNFEPDYHPLEKPEFVHDFLTFSNWNRVYRATADFFARKPGR